eukprot:m.423408 g.423408  ORF g.423408 m.423408 type:complete len:963 (-) comp20211_c2_seq3:1711-4599(-)
MIPPKSLQQTTFHEQHKEHAVFILPCGVRTPFNENSNSTTKPKQNFHHTTHAHTRYTTPTPKCLAHNNLALTLLLGERFLEGALIALGVWELEGFDVLDADSEFLGHVLRGEEDKLPVALLGGRFQEELHADAAVDHVHVHVKFVESAKRALHGLPQRHDKRDGGERALTARERRRLGAALRDGLVDAAVGVGRYAERQLLLVVVNLHLAGKVPLGQKQAKDGFGAHRHVTAVLRKRLFTNAEGPVNVLLQLFVAQNLSLGLLVPVSLVLKVARNLNRVAVLFLLPFYDVLCVSEFGLDGFQGAARFDKRHRLFGGFALQVFDFSSGFGCLAQRRFPRALKLLETLAVLFVLVLGLVNLVRCCSNATRHLLGAFRRRLVGSLYFGQLLGQRLELFLGLCHSLAAHVNLRLDLVNRLPLLSKVLFHRLNVRWRLRLLRAQLVRLALERIDLFFEAAEVSTQLGGLFLFVAHGCVEVLDVGTALLKLLRLFFHNGTTLLNLLVKVGNQLPARRCLLVLDETTSSGEKLVAFEGADALGAGWCVFPHDPATFGLVRDKQVLVNAALVDENVEDLGVVNVDHVHDRWEMRACSRRISVDASVPIRGKPHHHNGHGDVHLGTHFLEQLVVVRVGHGKRRLVALEDSFDHRRPPLVLDPNVRAKRPNRRRMKSINLRQPGNQLHNRVTIHPKLVGLCGHERLNISSGPRQNLFQFFDVVIDRTGVGADACHVCRELLLEGNELVALAADHLQLALRGFNLFCAADALLLVVTVRLLTSHQDEVFLLLHGGVGTVQLARQGKHLGLELLDVLALGPVRCLEGFATLENLVDLGRHGLELSLGSLLLQPGRIGRSLARLCLFLNLRTLVVLAIELELQGGGVGVLFVDLGPDDLLLELCELCLGVCRLFTLAVAALCGGELGLHGGQVAAALFLNVALDDFDAFLRLDVVVVHLLELRRLAKEAVLVLGL